MRILHVFRAPIGGLFRHIRDLAQAQAELGHEIGIICDANTGGPQADDLFAELKPHCSLGIKRISMGRLPGFGDIMSARDVGTFAKQVGFDILHGHGAKGGVYARLAASRAGAKAVYTAHGGTLHYSWKSPTGLIFLGVERLLLTKTDGLVFVCDYEKRTFDEKLGIGSTKNCVVHNGLWPHEFSPTKVSKTASDVLFIGELRMLKGVDVLIEALADIDGATATIVGDGPDRGIFETLVNSKGLSDKIKFTGAMPAHDAFGLGKLMVIPSRHESFPYIVLEAIAAHKPIIASDVGGIGEVLDASCLVRANDKDCLKRQIQKFLAEPETAQTQANDRAKLLKEHKSVHAMASQICAFYDTL